jgi:hypothetical protein
MPLFLTPLLLGVGIKQAEDAIALAPPGTRNPRRDVSGA